MRYLNYLQEKESPKQNEKVKKALNLGEPQVGGDYAPEKVKRYLKIIDDALAVMKNAEENDFNDAVVADLRNKKKAWQNVDQETKPVKTKTEVPPEQEEEPQQPPQQQGQEEEEPQESRLLRFIRKTS